MAEIPYRERENDEELLLPPGPDRLGVLSSTRQVVEEGENVWLEPDRLRELAARWAQQVSSGRLSFSTPAGGGGDERYHFSDGSDRTANWVLVLDALNFCFWPEKGQPRWRIDYQGQTLNGYWAEAASLKRAIEEGRPLWDAGYLSNIGAEELASIFRGQETIPLFEERLHNLREVGRVLLERFDGQFARAIEEARGSAVALTLLLAEVFPSFRDITRYRGAEVRFLKRAQICVADLHGSFGGEGRGAFSDLDALTAFADYKLPQYLRHFGVLEYDPNLAERIDNQELLQPGGEEEVEIRAATIWACELLRRELATHSIPVSAAQVDQQIWLQSQEIESMRPYHRVRTIYY